MLKRVRREFYLLSRGEQRGLLSVSFLLVLAMLFRFILPVIPSGEKPGMEIYLEEARLLLDSLNRVRPAYSKIGGNGDPVSRKSPIANRKSNPGAYNKKPQNPSPGKTRLPVELNSADSLALLPLPGIGPVLAGRIIKYRRLLGGYYTTTQLREVYGLREESFLLLDGRIKVDTSLLVRINLNEATFRDLLRHPYLDMEHVKALMAYRDFTGSFEEIAEIREAELMPDSVFARIHHYLCIE